MENPRIRSGIGILLIVAVAVVAAFAQDPPRVTPRPEGLRLKRGDLFNRDLVESLSAMGTAGPRKIETNDELEALPPNTLLAARLKQGAIAMTTQVGESGKQYLLPYRLRFTGAGSEDWNLRTVAIVEGNGLHLDPVTRRFRATVRVGVQNSDTPGSPAIEFPQGIPFLVTFDLGQAEPGELLIRHTNLPYERVTLDAAEARPPAFLTVRAAFDPQGVQVPVGITMPGSELHAPETIPGFGFGYGTIVFQLPRSLVGSVTEVTLHASKGSLEPTRIRLSETGSGEARLRSEGLGEVTVGAADGDLGARPVTVRFTWPIGLAIGILLGALIGGYLYQSGGGKGGFLAGLLAGVVIGAAACAGINLGDLPLPTRVTEVVAGVFAALPGLRRLKPVGP